MVRAFAVLSPSFHSQKAQSLTLISVHTVQRIRDTEPGDSLQFFQQSQFSLTSFLGEKIAITVLTTDFYFSALQAGCHKLFSLLEVPTPHKLWVRPFLWVFIFNSRQCVKLISSGECKVPGGLGAD